MFDLPSSSFSAQYCYFVVCHRCSSSFLVSNQCVLAFVRLCNIFTRGTLANIDWSDASVYRPRVEHYIKEMNFVGLITASPESQRVTFMTIDQIFINTQAIQLFSFRL